MLGATSSVEGVLKDFQTKILPKISGEPTREALIDLYELISGNEASMASKFIGGRHGHFVLTMTAEEYMEHTGYAFVPTHNPCDYPPTTGTAQE